MFTEQNALETPTDAVLKQRLWNWGRVAFPHPSWDAVGQLFNGKWALAEGGMS